MKPCIIPFALAALAMATAPTQAAPRIVQGIPHSCWI